MEAGMALLEDVCPQVLQVIKLLMPNNKVATLKLQPSNLTQDPRYVFRLVKLKFGEKCSEGADAEALSR